MTKKIEVWTIDDLRKRVHQINFPYYQREPTVWSKDAKQRLVDSIVRDFDIAPLYFYARENDFVDCVDGRQRIGAIMSFLNENSNDDHNGFPFRTLNELYDDDSRVFAVLQDQRYCEILDSKEENQTAERFIKKFLGFNITVVKLSDSLDHNEFNLQFARLNLGTIINSGERLNAMVGDLRDICFDDLGKHHLLSVINIPERRFAREQTIAQILTQMFSLMGKDSEYTRTRLVDLQREFKAHNELDPESHRVIDRIRSIMDLLMGHRNRLAVIRSRALVVSMILLAHVCDVDTEDEAEKLSRFMEEFVLRLKWQIGASLL